MLFLFSTILLNATECGCGSMESGRTIEYSTSGDSDCCSGRQEPDSKVYSMTWSPGPGRTFILDDIQEITFLSAMSVCCPSV